MSNAASASSTVQSRITSRSVLNGVSIPGRYAARRPIVPGSKCSEDEHFTPDDVGMEILEGIAVLKVTSVAQWREWLAAASVPSVWLVLRRKGSPEPGVLVHEAMEQALCFGWIDSKALRRDAFSTYLCFTPRNPRSTWSKVNRERVARLTSAGQMTPGGQAMVDLARRTGTWDALAEAQDGVVPPDLRRAFDGGAAGALRGVPAAA